MQAISPLLLWNAPFLLTFIPLAAFLFCSMQSWFLFSTYRETQLKLLHIIRNSLQEIPWRISYKNPSTTQSLFQVQCLESVEILRLVMSCPETVGWSLTFNLNIGFAGFFSFWLTSNSYVESQLARRVDLLLSTKTTTPFISPAWCANS